MKNIQIPFAFSLMAKPLGAACNLNCTYCYYLEKSILYPKSNSFVMQERVLEKFIKEYIEIQQAPNINFVWQGGEPLLLGIDFFEKVIQLQSKYAGRKQIENSLQTNGTLLNDGWGKFLKKNNFLVGISIDGPEKIHDYYRKYKNNAATFRDVVRGIEVLKKYSIEFNTLTVVNKNSSGYPLEIYHFLKEIGSRYLQFIPIVERVANTSYITQLQLVLPDYSDAKVTSWSVDPAEYGDFLIAIFNEWVRNDVGKYFVQLFDATLANWIGLPPGLCVLAETCGDALVIEHNGDIYSCDHFVYQEYKLGNILENPLISIVNSARQVKFGLNKTEKLPKFCLSCAYRFACHGECPKYRFTFTKKGEPGLNYLCVAYKNFFSHVHPFMQYMADEIKKKRTPANVMQWANSIKL